MADNREGRRPEDDEPPVVIRDKRKFDSAGNRREPVAEPSAAAPAAADPINYPADEAGTELTDSDVDTLAELLDLQTQLADRTTDLQRLSAEYSNYRKRVERDRVAVGEIAAGRVIEALLPVLDDVDRADQHGDLTGAFKTVADKLVSTLEALGLQAFGQVGDPFDPAIHEAVMHDQSDDVTEASATTVMRKGYRQGERLLRPAMVGVSEPTS